MAGWSSANKYALLGGHAVGRAAAQLRAADRPVRGVGGPGRRHALAERHRRRVAAGGGCSGSCPARSCSSSPRWPSCSGRRSTCRSPTPRSSSGPTPSTPGCGSRSSCCRSTRASSSCRCCSRCCSSAAGAGPAPSPRLGVDAAQGVRHRGAHHLAAGRLAPDARGPAAASRLGLVSSRSRSPSSRSPAVVVVVTG